MGMTDRGGTTDEQVTIHTTYPVASEAVLPILETILQMNGAVLVRNGSLYKILPAADLKDIALAPSVGSESTRSSTI